MCKNISKKYADKIDKILDLAQEVYTDYTEFELGAYSDYVYIEKNNSYKRYKHGFCLHIDGLDPDGNWNDKIIYVIGPNAKSAIKKMLRLLTNELLKKISPTPKLIIDTGPIKFEQNMIEKIKQNLKNDVEFWKRCHEADTADELKNNNQKSNNKTSEDMEQLSFPFMEENK